MERKANPLSRYMLGKKIIALAICLVGLTGALYAEAGSGPEVKALPAYEPLQLRSALPSTQESESSLPQSRGVTPVLFEDFEAGAPDWYTVDETATPPTWHTDEYNAYGGAGKSWWMGDPEVDPNGGYLDHWYQVLDTPPIRLPEAGEIILSFYQFRAIEEPDVYGNFDGWDGFNVRIRLAGEEYAEAAILTDCEPAYNCSSMYSFGFEHGEDPDGIPGIPGWGGFTGGWIPTEITIPSDYQGQNVIISFAFASDPAYCTSDNPSLTGVFVDNISVGSFYNDGEDETGFYPFSNVPVGGDLWHIYEDSSAPSPTHAEGCFDENTGTYNPNMENFLVSPKIEFPSGTEITWDMYVKTGLDGGVFPNCDYIYVQIRSFMDGEWQPWISISNPTYDPDGDNYVFTGTIEEWYPFSQGWPGYSNISVLAGLADSIQMRVGLHSNADEPTTIGFHVDNFGIYSALEVLPPSNLTGNYVDGNVELTWSPPTGLGGEMQWDDGSFENGIYFSSGTGYIGEEFPVGGACTIEEFTVFGYQFGGPTTVGVFEKSEGVYSSTPTYTMPITTQANAPATYQVDWDVQDDFILAFLCSNTIDIALDENTVPSEHSYVLSGGAWVTWQATAASAGLPDGEFGVRCTTTHPAVDLPNEYNVYHSLASGDYTEPIATVTDTSYTHSEPVGGTDNFYVVSAVYDAGESDFSNEVAVFAENPNYVEYAYDDGTAESSYHAGYPQSYLAVRVTPEQYPVAIRRLKYYITDVTQQVVLQIWDDDGEDGLPGTQLLTPPLVLSTADQIENTWNTVTLDSTVYDIEILNGDFYIGWFEGNNASLIGVDSDGVSYDRSYQYTDGEWYDYNDGIPQNFMMRVVVEPIFGIGTEPETDFVLMHYPNPVRSTTTFHCNIKGSHNQEVEIEIYNILGQLVDTVKGKNGEDIVWTNENLANGIYFYKVKSDEDTQIKKMVILR